MRIALACLIVLLFIPSGNLAAGDSVPPLQILKSPDQVQVSEGDRPVLTYQCSPTSRNGEFIRAGYVHPLVDLDGNTLTEDFPDDHPHHRGIFWAWHQLYVGEERIGDPWICKDFLAEVRCVEILPSCRPGVSFEATVDWTSPLRVDREGTAKPIVREHSRIRVSPRCNGIRTIDFRISLLALEDGVRIGGSDDAKGYGGFSPRFRLPDGLRFLADWGPATPRTQSVDASPWLDLTAPFGDSDHVSGVTILCHPSVPGYPQRWILRQKRSMQNPVYPGRHPVPLKVDDPLVFRYRLVLHRGEVTAEQIRKWHAAYSAE